MLMGLASLYQSIHGSKNQKILSMDSMQSTTAKDIGNDTSYLSLMEKNLAVLKDALK